MNKEFSGRQAVYRYIITETGTPTSLDPLEADNTQNLPVVRMIYATPLEVNSKGSLSSHVLSDFAYDAEHKTMTWKVREGLRFSDGSTLSAEDVAFAVARMAHARPRFPVLEDIEGIEAWAKKPAALKSWPTGISISQNEIKIRFTRDQEHPLFRFCLEIFSIIPKRCIDTTTNKVSCKEIPTSGYYKMESSTGDAIIFKGGGQIHGEFAPKEIHFEYVASNNLLNRLSSFDNHTVVSGNELKFSPEAMVSLKSALPTVFAPAARIGILLINPKVGPFDNKGCRRVFADAYRKAYGEFSKGDRSVEASLFTDLLPGYMNRSELEHLSTLTEDERRKCLLRLQSEGLPLSRVAQDDNVVYANVNARTFKILDMPVKRESQFAERKAEVDAFSKGEIGFLPASTGFWALDPAGDVQMLFTPNMHAMLKYVSNDSKLQALIKRLNNDLADRPAAYRELNQYLHEEALFNIFTHIRRFFSSPNRKLIAELPISITSPSPWQVFRVAE